MLKESDVAYCGEQSHYLHKMTEDNNMKSDFRRADWPVELDKAPDKQFRINIM
jgi:hypothetical protein